jgi:hypothetical protein
MMPIRYSERDLRHDAFCWIRSSTLPAALQRETTVLPIRLKNKHSPNYFLCKRGVSDREQKSVRDHRDFGISRTTEIESTIE